MKGLGIYRAFGTLILCALELWFRDLGIEMLGAVGVYMGVPLSWKR